jgi:hypothetical protein
MMHGAFVALMILGDRGLFRLPGSEAKKVRRAL